MAPRTNVRQHTRTTKTGKRTTVRRHTRGLVSPRHAWGLFRRAVKAGKRKRRVVAFVFGALAAVEFGAWLMLTGSALILATAAVLAGAVAYSAAMLSGMPVPGGTSKTQARTTRPGSSTAGKQQQQRGRQDPKPAPAGKPAGADGPRPGADPVTTLGKLGAIWSDDFDAYASGTKGAGEVHCALCQCAPCRCPPFGSDAYFKLLDFRHGRGKKAGTSNGG